MPSGPVQAHVCLWKGCDYQYEDLQDLKIHVLDSTCHLRKSGELKKLTMNLAFLVWVPSDINYRIYNYERDMIAAPCREGLLEHWGTKAHQFSSRMWLCCEACGIYSSSEKTGTSNRLQSALLQIQHIRSIYLNTLNVSWTWVRTSDLTVVVLLSSNQSTVANLGSEKRSLEKKRCWKASCEQNNR